MRRTLPLPQPPSRFRLAVALVAMAAMAAPCVAEEAPAAPAPATAPATPARPMLKLRPPSALRLELRNREDLLPGAGLAGATLPATRTVRMKQAFAAELRKEAIESRRASLYATIPTELPELLEDDWIRKQQERVAESVIGDAVEAALSEGFFGGRHHRSTLSIRPVVAAAEHGLKVDGTPSWSYRIRAPRGGFSVDVPLTPSSVRLHAYRDLRGSNRREMRLGGGLLIDPFDEEIRAGVSLQF